MKVFRTIRTVRIPAWAKPRELMWFVGGALAAAIISASAQYASSAAQSDADCELALAARNAMNSKVQMIGATSTDPSKFFQVGGDNSCLGDFSLANIDLSRLIPDPLGLITDGLSKLVDGMIDKAISAACSVARQSMGNIVGSYNNAVGLIQGVADAPKYMLDAAIGQTSANIMNQASMAWSTSPVNRASLDVLSAVNQTKGSIPGGYNISNAVSATTNSLSQIQNSAAGFSTAASALTTAKMNLDQANSVVASYANNPDGVPAWAQQQQQQAKAAYDKALATYDASKSQVTSPTGTASADVTSSVTKPSSSTGSSIFQ